MGLFLGEDQVTRNLFLAKSSGSVIENSAWMKLLSSIDLDQGRDMKLYGVESTKIAKI